MFDCYPPSKHPLGMASYFWGVTALLILFACVTGCSLNQANANNPLEIDHSEYARVYNAAIAVLREYGFSLDRQDYRFGRITTKPQNSPTALEPWNNTNTTSNQILESTINHQRRLVTVSLEPISPTNPITPTPIATRTATDGYHLRIEVFVERRQTPNRRLAGSTRGHRVFDTLRSTPIEWQNRGIKGSYWRPLGRDPYLEQRLLNAIIRQSFNLNNPQARMAPHIHRSNPIIETANPPGLPQLAFTIGR